MAEKNNSWFGDRTTLPVKPAAARLVHFGNVAQKLVPGAGAVLDAVYIIERQRAVSAGDKTETVKTDFVLRLVSE